MKPAPALPAPAPAPDPMPAPRVVVVSPEELEALMVRAVRKAGAAASGPPAAEVLTREAVARLLDIHPTVVSRYVKELGLPGIRMGGEWRFLRSEVMAWLTKQQRLEGKKEAV
jgi:excisionase family DNA binding protein